MASNNSNVGSGSDNFGGDVVANRSGNGHYGGEPYRVLKSKMLLRKTRCQGALGKE
ncbi:hypothetical protein JHK82_022796 [Glycine max]|nr:hypothetical protein JHK87_022711 [Glycine soja]KAG5017164.1 hypothetical protein JHK85_023300 [Glycine max]KAG5026919.1 hypothetical protein JHK86_022833 [Glycine max]KAG5138065.1 hypothetical protein JHK82_022796 [Glycine max]